MVMFSKNCVGDRGKNNVYDKGGGNYCGTLVTWVSSIVIKYTISIKYLK